MSATNTPYQLLYRVIKVIKTSRKLTVSIESRILNEKDLEDIAKIIKHSLSDCTETTSLNRYNKFSKTLVTSVQHLLHGNN